MALTILGALSLSSSLNLSTVGNTLVVPMAPTKRLALSVNGLIGSGATLAIDGSRDGGNTWLTTGMTGVDYDTGAAVAAFTDDADYRVITRGYTHLQVRVVTAGSGSALLLLVSQARAQDTFGVNPSGGGGGGGGNTPTGAAGSPNPAAVTVQGIPGGTPQAVTVARLAGVTTSNSTASTVTATTTGAASNILPADPLRSGFTIRNPSMTATMYLVLGPAAATLINWRFALSPGGRLDNEGWQGAVSAVWSAADSSQAMIWSDAA